MHIYILFFLFLVVHKIQNAKTKVDFKKKKKKFSI